MSHNPIRLLSTQKGEVKTQRHTQREEGVRTQGGDGIHKPEREASLLTPDLRSPASRTVRQPPLSLATLANKYHSSIDGHAGSFQGFPRRELLEGLTGTCVFVDTGGSLAGTPHGFLPSFQSMSFPAPLKPPSSHGTLEAPPASQMFPQSDATELENVPSPCSIPWVRTRVLPLPALAAETHAGSSDSPSCGAACGVDGTLVHPFKLASTWLRFTLVVNLGVSLTCVERRQNLKASDVLTLTSH